MKMWTSLGPPSCWPQLSRPLPCAALLPRAFAGILFELHSFLFSVYLSLALWQVLTVETSSWELFTF